MKIPLVDLVTQYHSIREEIDQAIHGVLESGAFILGRNVTSLEEEVAKYLGVRFAVGVASGTDALLFALQAYGIGSRDEVIVPAFTFFATAEVVSRIGATPVFVDIDPRTFCLEVKDFEAKITARTKAVIPVHLYGHPADMAPILRIAKKCGIKVIEDNAQAMGAEYRGRKTGSLGDAGCLSFFPSKNLGGYGDGGMVVTDDAKVANTVRKLRNHGWEKKYSPETLGYNSRLDELQAAILRVKLRYLDSWNKRRREVAKRYQLLLGGAGGKLPWEGPSAKHVYHLYVIRVKSRMALQERLKASGITSGIYYRQPLHLLEVYRHLGYGSRAFPEAERASQETLAIPLYPEMEESQVEAVASVVGNAKAFSEALPQKLPAL